MRLSKWTDLLTLVHGVSSSGGVAAVASRVLEALPEWEAAAGCEWGSKLAEGADGECACKRNGSGCLCRNRLRRGAGVDVDSKGRRRVGVGVHGVAGAGIEFLCEEGNLDDSILGSS